ncbi:hypothetical protein PJ985_08225 [Streptomyces sp. ACA25]|uniref:hypothetical protein n=1 Tax=Streptomyces sp. ACA25 TaxID=3022596 RepID=UPI002308081D|nr:hypothetical protein [Streptomyces sp. ACA25]MDB1087551.1 hypothetical protein [Streptomyces sp. ACA25]
MGAHAAVPGDRSIHPVTSLAVGALVGAYAALLDRGSGASAGRTLVLGLVTCAVVAAVGMLLVRRLPLMPRTGRALTTGVSGGLLIGYLSGLTSGTTVVGAVFIGAVFGVVVGTAGYLLRRPQKM